VNRTTRVAKRKRLGEKTEGVEEIPHGYADQGKSKKRKQPFREKNWNRNTEPKYWLAMLMVGKNALPGEVGTEALKKTRRRNDRRKESFAHTKAKTLGRRVKQNQSKKQSWSFSKSGKNRKKEKSSTKFINTSAGETNRESRKPRSSVGSGQHRGGKEGKTKKRKKDWPGPGFSV